VLNENWALFFILTWQNTPGNDRFSSEEFIDQG